MPQIDIGMGRVIYNIKALSVVIRVAFNFQNRQFLAYGGAETLAKYAIYSFMADESLQSKFFLIFF